MSNSHNDKLKAEANIRRKRLRIRLAKLGGNLAALARQLGISRERARQIIRGIK